jgi:hypothetical protein
MIAPAHLADGAAQARHALFPSFWRASDDPGGSSAREKNMREALAEKKELNRMFLRSRGSE